MLAKNVKQHSRLVPSPAPAVGRLFPCLPALLLLALAGCTMVEDTAKMPARMVQAAVPASKSGAIDPALLQTELMRYADEYSSRTTAALDEYARIAATPQARHHALTWKVSVGSASVAIASGPNPLVNLLDLLSLATITRTAVEEFRTTSPEGAVFQPWLEASRALETNAWVLAGNFLTAGQQQELRASILAWWQANAGDRTGFFARPQEFSALIRQMGQKPDRPGSVFSLVGLDPTAGLDPAVREVTRTRLFAERAIYAAQRMPFLLRWQTELMTDELVHGPGVAATLTNLTRLTDSADRISRAAESASQTAAQLPDRITAERKAILAELQIQEGRLRELSREIGFTLASGEKMSASLNTTLQTFDALMKRFGVGEPATNTAAAKTNTVPFNILDYAHTAEQITAMARQLDVLLKDTGATLDSPALQQRMKDLGAVSNRATADAKSVLNHAFLLGAGLVLLTLACALAYRAIAHRGGAGGNRLP